MKTLHSWRFIFLISFSIIGCKKETNYPVDLKLNNDLLNSAKNGGGSTVDITLGLKAYYPFSSNANDASGNGNNGIVTGATLTTDKNGRKNQAYYFSGNSNFIDINNKFFDNGWPNSTISFWVNPASYGLWPSKTGGRTILNTYPHNGTSIAFDYNGSKTFAFWKNIDPVIGNWDVLGFSKFDGEISILNKWYFITIVKSGKNYSYYLNGSLNKIETASQEPISYFCPIRIGAPSWDNIEWEFFEGKLDEFRFYDRSLSETEIRYLYNK